MAETAHVTLLDRVVRSMAAATSRRAFLKGAFSTLVVAGIRTQTRVAAQNCEVWELDCGGFCTDPNWDVNNCGSCGYGCSPDQTCRYGACEQLGGCESWQTDCDGYCTDVSTDNSHCGWCGNVCQSGTTCAGGTCQGETGCQYWQTDCGGYCVDLNSDRTNCGWCGNACANAWVCSAGACLDPDGCGLGSVDCGGYCTDLRWDTFNCGWCGNVCPANIACNEGTCQGGIACAQDANVVACGNDCVDLSSDSDNCGSCGNRCPSVMGCFLGQCCGDWPLVPCNGVCASLADDPYNCGNCGNECESGVCENGQCRSGCQSGRTLCGGDCYPFSENCCVDLQTDSNNCGSCGNRCPTDEMGFCNQGVCDCQVNRFWPCGDVCVEISNNPDHCGTCFHRCASGICKDRACLPIEGVTANPDVSGACPINQARCGDKCIDVSADRQNCGRCGNQCKTGEECIHVAGEATSRCVLFGCIGQGPNCPEPAKTPDFQPGKGRVVAKQGNGLVTAFIDDADPAHAVIGIRAPLGVSLTLGAKASQVGSFNIHADTPWASQNMVCAGGETKWTGVFGIGGAVVVEATISDDAFNETIVLGVLEQLAKETALAPLQNLSCSGVETVLKVAGRLNSMEHFNNALLITTDLGSMLDPAKWAYSASELQKSFTEIGEVELWAGVLGAYLGVAPEIVLEALKVAFPTKASLITILEATFQKTAIDANRIRANASIDRVTFVLDPRL